MPSTCLFEGTHKVEHPNGEWPSNWDHLQGMCGLVRLLGVELTPMACSDQALGVPNGGRPIEALTEGVPNQGPRRCVVAASPRVHVAEELASLLEGDAALKDPGRASSVQLPLVAVDDVGLGPPSDASGLRLVFR